MPLPLDPILLARAAREHGTPLWCYDAAILRERIARLQGFDVVRFAQKACSNLHILRLMRRLGVQVDAVSLGEIERALLAGYSPTPTADGAELVLTCDLFDRPLLRRVVELGVEVNVGSLDMLDQLGQCSPGHRVWLRINPGFGHGHSRKTNTGGEHSKHGIWHTQLDQALARVRQYGLTLVGLHMHIGSGVDYAHLEQVAEAMASLVERIDHDLEAISAGGGLSIPYQAGAPEVDLVRYAATWAQARQRAEAAVGHRLRLEIEPGRYLVAEAGCLVSEVRAVKEVGANRFVLVDAGFNDLARPTLYGSYHGMRVLEADGTPVQRPSVPSVVAGPLCEAGDVFTQDGQGQVLPRPLPEARVGDWLVIEDTGAYGASMSSNYNSRLLPPEVLIEEGQLRLIRRRQTFEALFAAEQI
ncbi:MAG: Diaminopimelate decarboxylase [Pseudomonas citronellolis]|nr:MAG: Diaminopimelate decarboxylase [Pseudomonas citronellolis]